MTSVADSVRTTTGAVEDEHGDLSGVIVGIPSYNEEVAIGSVVLACRELVEQVVVVDDGSHDQTAELAERAGATVLRHGENRGKGAAIQTLFDHVRDREFEALVLLDGDGQHLPTDIPTVVSPVLADDYDLVIGSRYLDHNGGTETPLYRRLGQRVLDVITASSARRSFSDSQSGFRAFSREAVESLSLRSEGLGIESEMISASVDNGLKIGEEPIDVRYDGIDGQTHNPVRHGAEVLTFLIRLVRDRHPLLFFGVPGIVLCLVGFAYGANAVYVYQTTGQFYPAKILASGFTLVTGLLGVFCGLILNSIANMIDRATSESRDPERE